MDESFAHQKCVKVLCSQNSQQREDTVDSFLMILLCPVIYLHNKSLAWMKYVAPGGKYRVLMETILPCKQFDDRSFDFRVSFTGIYISFFFIVIIIERSTISKYAFS